MSNPVGDLPEAYRIALRPDREDSDLLDDVVVKDVSMFRAEMMDDRSLWMCCYFPGTDERLTFHVQATKRKGKKLRLEFVATEQPFAVSPGFLYEDER